MSQVMTFASLLPAARVRPSGENPTLWKVILGESRSRLNHSRLPEAASQRDTELGNPHEASNDPSGENATERASSSENGWDHFGWPVARSTRSNAPAPGGVQSPTATARDRPSGEKADLGSTCLRPVRRLPSHLRPVPTTPRFRLRDLTPGSGHRGRTRWRSLTPSLLQGRPDEPGPALRRPRVDRAPSYPPLARSLPSGEKAIATVCASNPCCVTKSASRPSAERSHSLTASPPRSRMSDRPASRRGNGRGSHGP